MTATMVLSPGPLSTIGEEQPAQHAAVTAFRQPLPGEPYTDVPVLVVASDQKALKAEDVLYIKQVQAQPGQAHSLFIVCDGHQGVDAASFTAQKLPKLLEENLPGHLPDWQDRTAVTAYAEQMRSTLSRSVVELENQWLTFGSTAGTTCTLVLVSGWLLTVANTGDSSAVIDDGVVVKEVTHSHRIQVNPEEQERLRRCGATLAPLGFHLQGPAKPKEMGVGPLRLWPGGLCVSRSIGDSDTGPLVVPLPHIRQLLVPRRGGLRLLMASDGLWDLLSFDKAASSVRHKLPHQAVSSLLQTAMRDKRMSDDTSVIILDVLASANTQFPAAALQQAATAAAAAAAPPAPAAGPAPSPPAKQTRSKGGGGGLFSCFRGSGVREFGAEGGSVSGRSRRGGNKGAALRPIWEYLADVDCLKEYPHHLHQLSKTSLPLAGAEKQAPTGDYTVHGGDRARMFKNDDAWYLDRTVHGGGAGGSHHSSPGPSLHAGSLYENSLAESGGVLPVSPLGVHCRTSTAPEETGGTAGSSSSSSLPSTQRLSAPGDKSNSGNGSSGQTSMQQQPPAADAAAAAAGSSALGTTASKKGRGMLRSSSAVQLDRDNGGLQLGSSSADPTPCGTAHTSWGLTHTTDSNFNHTHSAHTSWGLNHAAGSSAHHTPSCSAHTSWGTGDAGGSSWGGGGGGGGGCGGGGGD